MMDWLARQKWFLALWSLRTGWLLWYKWNAPRGHEARCSLIQQIQYAWCLTDMMEDGYMSPSEAIDEDRHYWTD